MFASRRQSHSIAENPLNWRSWTSLTVCSSQWVQWGLLRRSFCSFYQFDIHHEWGNSLETPQVMRQIISGLSFLHGKHIAHRDLKPERRMIFVGDSFGKILVKFRDFPMMLFFGQEFSKSWLILGQMFEDVLVMTWWCLRIFLVMFGEFWWFCGISRMLWSIRRFFTIKLRVFSQAKTQGVDRRPWFHWKNHHVIAGKIHYKLPSGYYNR